MNGQLSFDKAVVALGQSRSRRIPASTSFDQFPGFVAQSTAFTDLSDFVGQRKEDHLNGFLDELIQTVFDKTQHKSSAFDACIAVLAEFAAIGREASGDQLMGEVIQSGLALVVACNHLRFAEDASVEKRVPLCLLGASFAIVA